METKKNCENCKHLVWWSGEPGEQEGFICEGREYTNGKREREHLTQLESPKYREKAKRCFYPSARSLAALKKNV